MNKLDYKNLSEITVKTQVELDMIPLDFDGRIYVEFGTYWDKAIIKNKYYYRVVARGNSSVEAWENSSVVARGNSSVEAWGNSSVEAWGNSSVEAWENSSVAARENSSVVARGNSSVVAWENSSVEAWENSSVVAWENSSVVAWGNSSVEAWGNSSVEARGNSSVVARGNSSVVARGNSSVEAQSNVQVVDCLQGAKIQISGNARIVCNPKNIHEFFGFYDIKHNKKTATFYKAVRKNNGEYYSDYDSKFEYFVGERAIEKCDSNTDNDCSFGIHISHLSWALDFGRNWNNLAILEVETNIDDIVLPIYSNGKVRTSSVKVIREVPLSECGVFGKILSKRISGGVGNV